MPSANELTAFLQRIPQGTGCVRGLAFPQWFCSGGRSSGIPDVACQSLRIGERLCPLPPSRCRLDQASVYELRARTPTDLHLPLNSCSLQVDAGRDLAGKAAGAVGCSSPRSQVVALGLDQLCSVRQAKR